MEGVEGIVESQVLDVLGNIEAIIDSSWMQKCRRIVHLIVCVGTATAVVVLYRP